MQNYPQSFAKCAAVAAADAYFLAEMKMCQISSYGSSFPSLTNLTVGRCVCSSSIFLPQVDFSFSLSTVISFY